jgi:hypothetical protein
MKNSIIIIFSFIALVACESSNTGSAHQTALSLVSNVQLTDEPSPDSEVLRLVHVGDTLEILQHNEEGYTLVSTADKIDGWIENKYLAFSVSPCAFTSPTTAYSSPSLEATEVETFYPLDFVSIISSDGSGWSEVIGQPSTADSVIRAWVLSENLTMVDREVIFTIKYNRAMAINDSSQRSRELFNLYNDPYLKESELLFAATYSVIHADE